MNDLRHSFPNQQANEPVFVFARPYPVAFLPIAGIFFIILLFSFLAQFLIAGQFLVPMSQFAVNAGMLFISLFQLVLLIVFFVAVFDFYFDIVIVTDRRLVEITQEQLFFRRVSELDLEDIEDVASQQKGLLQTVFNYGSIEVQTAGATPNFLMENIYLPREVAAIILDLKDQVEENRAASERFPRAPIVGVINNKAFSDAPELQEAGALLPQEVGRTKTT